MKAQKNEYNGMVVLGSLAGSHLYQSFDSDNGPPSIIVDILKRDKYKIFA
jgi:hypothetical protein